MTIELTDTSAAEISSELLKTRRTRFTSGMVFTLVVVTDEEHFEQVYLASLAAGAEHPSRVLVLMEQRDAEDSGLDAVIHTSAEIPGEVITLRAKGELEAHADSVVLPLLLPDSPVVVWWPHESPRDPASDQIGLLATRRVTDASGAIDPLRAMRIRAEHHAPGDTDLTWTRLTPWRALLAAGVDQYPAEVTMVTVSAAERNAPAELMAAWLEARLGVEVERKTSEGPGLTEVRLSTKEGDIVVAREPGASVATYSVPEQPSRKVALNRRSLNELITEELRRMDADEAFEEATQTLLIRCQRQAETARLTGGGSA